MEKIAFVTTEGSRKKVWNPEAEQLAARLGFDVRYAATPEAACHDADGIMTSWGSPCFSRAVPADSEYLTLPGLVMTPHMGADGGTPHYAGYVLSQMRRFFDGKGLEYEIDARRFATMTDERIARKK